MVSGNIVERKAQVSIFVVIAFLIVAVIGAYFVFRGGGEGGGISAELTPVYDYYQSCIGTEAKLAVQLASAQGGRINAEDYSPGSEYAPFSSHLNFLGSPVSYWYYVSANGVIKERVPKMSEIESDIASFVEDGLANCDFEQFYRKGFDINVGDPSADVTVFDNRVEIEVNADMFVAKGGDSGTKKVHSAEITSKLGKFYSLAREIYDKQKKETFLEDYAVDVLYSYAPVDGVEIQCAPKIWSVDKVVSDLKRGLEENFRTIKFKGAPNQGRDENNGYFVLDKQVDEAVNVMYLENWPTKIEIFGDGVDDGVMVAESIGKQEGMGIMGFCYVPYHYVYDVSFPAMFQIYDTEELFQFPVAVIIDNNVPRKADFSGVKLTEDVEKIDLCKFGTQDVDINVFDVNLNRIDANVSYECFDQSCKVGESKNGKLSGVLPGCVNGYLVLDAEGYADKKQLFSSNSESSASVIMEREYNVEIKLDVGGKPLDGTAIVSFVKDGEAKTIALPEQKSIKLSEGGYEIKVHVYGNSSVVIPASTKRQCVDVPKSGISGLFGGTDEECFDINVPETKIESALIGGGVTSTYLLESDLQSGLLTLQAQSLPSPTSIEELANNFEIFDAMEVHLEF